MERKNLIDLYAVPDTPGTPRQRVVPVFVILAPNIEGWFRQTLEALGVSDHPSDKRCGVVRPHQALGLAESSPAVFRNEGQYWTITFQGMTRQLDHMKGFYYIVYLLRRAGHDCPTTEILAAVDGAPADLPMSIVDAVAEGLSIVSDLGDAGEVIDPQAADEYQCRLRILCQSVTAFQQQLAEGEQLNDLGLQSAKREQLEHVLDEQRWLEQQLAEAGKPWAHRRRQRCPRKASHRERARQRVTKNLDAAFRKLRTSGHAALADHLGSHIKRGYACLYKPDFDHPIRWDL